MRARAGVRFTGDARTDLDALETSHPGVTEEVDNLVSDWKFVSPQPKGAPDPGKDNGWIYEIRRIRRWPSAVLVIYTATPGSDVPPQFVVEMVTAAPAG